MAERRWWTWLYSLLLQLKVTRGLRVCAWALLCAQHYQSPLSGVRFSLVPPKAKDYGSRTLVRDPSGFPGGASGKASTCNEFEKALGGGGDHQEESVPAALPSGVGGASVPLFSALGRNRMDRAPACPGPCPPRLLCVVHAWVRAMQAACLGPGFTWFQQELWAQVCSW